MKRLFDIFFAFVLLALLLPLFLFLFLVIRWKLGSPVLFRQVRPGQDGKPFTILKFRSMTDERDANGNLKPDKDRLTRLGIFLRSSSLDELPELFNVIKGDMSLVGPRPLRMEYLAFYSDRQARRHEVRPGITGWAQINGRNHITWEEKFDLDVWYVENQNFWLDLKILLLTVKQVLTKEGINYSDELPMPKFRGSHE